MLPPRPRPRVLEPRDDLPREREAVPRALAPPEEAAFLRVADARLGDLRAPVDRLEPVLDLVPAADDFVPALFVRDEAERALEDFAREAVDFVRDPLDLRAPLLREVPEDEEEAEPVLALPSTVHLPDITRCAASATASAISEPSLVALAMTLLAA